MKKNKINILAFLSLSLVLSCERNVVEPDETDIPDENSVYIEEDIVATWDSTNATKIELRGNEVEITGEGALFEGGQITISKGGEFHITGDLTNGKIKIAANEQNTVKLILDNVSLTSDDNACIYAETARNVIIVLNNESVNSLTDNSAYTSDEQNAVIFSRTDLALIGDGKLTIQANYKDGITSKDGLAIVSGNYEIEAIDDGIRGKDYLVVKDGTYTIHSGGDAIKSDNEDEGFGNIFITTGVFNITANADGIAAQSTLKIADGIFNINTSAGGNDISTKALKAGDLLYIEYGVFMLESVDDAVHSDYDILIVEGDFTIDTDDDGIHAEHDLVIENAAITINSSLEGIEGGYITVYDGTIDIKATDDGFNATQGREVMSDDGSQLTVKGGTITVNMSGRDVDAMDSNGDITITGGTVNLYFPTSGPSEALDANGKITIGSSASVYENGEVYTGSRGGPGGF